MRAAAVLLAVLAGVLSVLVGVAAPAQAATTNLVVSQTALDLGDVRMGTTSAVQRATVVNRGSARVRLDGAYASSGPFRQSGSCRGAALDPGAQCSLAMTFSPTTTGAATATLAATFAGVSL